MGMHSLDLVIRETVNTLVQTGACPEGMHYKCLSSPTFLLVKSAPPSAPTQESHAHLTIVGQCPETVQA